LWWTLWVWFRYCLEKYSCVLEFVHIIFVDLCWFDPKFWSEKKRVVFVVGGCYSCIGVGNCEIYDSLFIDYHSRVSLIHRNDQTALDGSLMQKWQQKDLDQWQTDMWTKGQKSWTNKIKMKIKKINNKKRK